MSWAKLDDHFHSHPKVVRAGNEALGVWARALSYCGAYLTDGVVPLEVVVGYCGDATKAAEIAGRLITAGLWEPVEGGYQVHDYLEYNPSAAEAKAVRERERAKKAEQRTKARRGDGGQFMSPGDSTGESRGESHRTRPVPSRPVPSDPEPTRPERARSEEDPSADALAPPRSRSRSKAAGKQQAEPLPYTVTELLETLATASQGRFVASALNKGQTIALQKTIRAHSLDDVRLAGTWLAAGGDGWKGTLDVRALRDLPAWVAQARAWEAGGRQPITRAAKSDKPSRIEPMAPQDTTQVLEKF